MIEWIAEKSASVIAFLIALVFIGLGFYSPQFRWICICIALIAIVYGYKQLKKHDTPFQRQEREIRRKRL
jgi:4-hydroxybenzoate polyprenyltransferase